mgnify:CR=1 FL=1
MVLKNKKFKKTVSILGSTGSIGKSTIDLIMRNPETFDIVALTAQTNVKILAQQARIVKPNLVVIGDHSKYKELKNSFWEVIIPFLIPFLNSHHCRKLTLRHFLGLYNYLTTKFP